MFLRMRLLWWRPNWIRSFLRTHLLRLPPRVAFFLTSKKSIVIACLYLLLSTPLALLSEGHSHSENNTRSLSSEGHSPDLSPRKSPPARSVCRHQLRALSLSSERQCCNRLASHVCAMVKGASKRRLRHHPKQTHLCPLPLGLDTILRAIATAATPPPILLLGRTCLVESPR
jgi:hypothetical protein